MLLNSEYYIECYVAKGRKGTNQNKNGIKIYEINVLKKRVRIVFNRLLLQLDHVLVRHDRVMIVGHRSRCRHAFLP